jgi:hypothetical protein
MALNVSRRAVLGGGAVGLAAAGISFGVSTAGPPVRPVVVIEESAIPESRQFAEALVDSGHAARIIRVDRSLNSLLHELTDTNARFAGLTSDPAAMIAAQLLVERGGRPILQWRHHYASGRWTHQTAGTPPLLASARSGWPTALAHHVRDTIGSPGSDRPVLCQSGACALAASSPGMLVSWVIEAGDQRS